MIRQSLVTKTRRGGQSASASPSAAPIDGWNTRDSDANMKPSYARELNNWYPRGSEVELRGGMVEFVPDLPGTVSHLLTYASSTDQELFAVAGSEIINITDGTYDPEIPGESLSNNNISYTTVSSLGGTYLAVVNGEDLLRYYNGTAWQSISGTGSPSITGIATSAFSYVTVFKRRLWFVEKGSMSGWYLPVNQIGGAATEFDFGQLFNRGGYLVALAGWSVDGGAGVDDLFAAITSEGEIAVYQGSDPSDANNWSLAGVFYVGEPLTKNCLVKYGGDLLLLSKQGLLPLSKLLLSGDINSANAMSDRISPTFARAAASYSTTLGWQITVYPKETALIVNVPVVVGSRYDQFVMNTQTGAWCSFSGWDGATFTVWQGALYAGRRSSVVKVWEGTSDLGANIIGNAKQAYNYLNTRIGKKHMKMLRPHLRTTSNIDVAVGFDVDFTEYTETSESYLTLAANALWDSGVWDTSVWGTDTATQSDWLTAMAPEGYAFSLRLRVETNSARVTWNATDFIFERGGLL